MTTPLTETELKELREKAEKANHPAEPGLKMEFGCKTTGSAEAAAAFVEYMAACDPQTILCLLDMIVIRDKAIALFKTVVNVDRLDEILAQAQRLLSGEERR